METMQGKHGSALITVPVATLEKSCTVQIQTFLDHPVFTNPIAIMPDTHAGSGAVIGFTMPMTERIIPNVIGVDIGCGMLSFMIGQELGVSHQDADTYVRAHVPFGMNVHDDPVLDMAREFPWEQANQLARQFAGRYTAQFGTTIEPPRYSMDWFLNKCREVHVDAGRVMRSLGSLGGGNHFIEIGRSQNTGNLWVTVHTGSRNFGLKIATYWQAIASKHIRKDSKVALQAEIQRIKHETADRTQIGSLIAEAKQRLAPVAPTGLEWLEGEDAHGYLFDMIFSQIYAEENRTQIVRVLERALRVDEQDRVVSVHNFIDFEDFVIRKGAIRSYAGERMVIPFNMRDGLLLCEGKSNEAWNFSAPHGAGRVMSRTQAKKALSMDDFSQQMTGVFSTSVCSGTLDEAPGAYKDPKLIEDAIEPTATIVDRVKPIHNMKAIEDGPSWKEKRQRDKRKGKKRR
ncbi:MAG: RtcB family protein [Patescibacteria group bacterium]